MKVVLVIVGIGIRTSSDSSPLEADICMLVILDSTMLYVLRCGQIGIAEVSGGCMIDGV